MGYNFIEAFAVEPLLYFDMITDEIKRFLLNFTDANTINNIYIASQVKYMEEFPGDEGQLTLKIFPATKRILVTGGPDYRIYTFAELGFDI